MVFREFHISDALQIWDSLFAYESNGMYESLLYDNKSNSKEIESPHGLLDFIIVSLILYLKDDLLIRDTSTSILQRLLTTESTVDIISAAIKVKYSLKAKVQNIKPQKAGKAKMDITQM